MANPSPAGADDDNRLFSEPPPSAAEVRGNGSDEASFSLETARAALLHLRDSVTSTEFRKLIEGVTDASAIEANENSTVSERSETSVSESDVDMEPSTSSDGGSTVRELNEQLLAGEGNTGSVSIESVVPGSTHSTDDHGKWTTATRKRKKSSASNGSKSSDASASGIGTVKKGRVDSGLTVYLKGQDFDIAKEAIRNPLEFTRKLTSIAGAVSEVKLLKDSVRVTCVAVKQKMILLQFTDWFGKPVTVTEPWGKAPTGNRRPAFQKGIIFGVSTEVSEYDIQSETKAEIARRIVKWTSGQQVKTGSVVLSYPETLPEFVYIGFLRYKVKPYIPQPIRCNKCQGFGHIAAHCKRQVRCVRCGKGHCLDECPVKDDLTKAVCVNCKGQHSAAFKGCTKYQEVSKALKVSVVDKVSYRDALVKVKSGVLQRTTDRVGDVRPLQTSTPIAAAAPQVPPRPAAVQPPPARRDLFESKSETNRVEQNGATAAKPARDAKQPPTSGYTIQDYMKQITHHLLYTLAILEGLKPSSEFAEVRSNLTNLARYAFGTHGSNPCLSPKCCR